jgi:hypothetical protein
MCQLGGFNMKFVDIKQITLEQARYYSTLGVSFIIKDGKIKGFSK